MTDERMGNPSICMEWSVMEPLIHPPVCADCDDTGRVIGKSPEMGLNLDFALCHCAAADGVGNGETMRGWNKSGKVLEPINTEGT